jgi:hypothetical protein
MMEVKRVSVSPPARSTRMARTLIGETGRLRILRYSMDARDNGRVIIPSFAPELENFRISFQDDLTRAQKWACRDKDQSKKPKGWIPPLSRRTRSHFTFPLTSSPMVKPGKRKGVLPLVGCAPYSRPILFYPSRSLKYSFADS